MKLSFCTKPVEVTGYFMKIDGQEFQVPWDFDDLVEALCKMDGYFALRGISDDSHIKKMIEPGLVNHSQNRGCYATDKLREIKDELLKKWYKKTS